MAKVATLEKSEKDNDIFSNAEMIKYMVEQKKAEFESWKSKADFYKTQVTSLEHRLSTAQAEHEQKLKNEMTKFNNEKNAKLGEIKTRLEVVDRAEADMARRKMALEARETEVENKNSVANKLIEEKMKYEKMNRELEESLRQASEKESKAQEKLNAASSSIKESKALAAENKNILSIIENSKSDLAAKEKSIAEQEANLKSLREDVTPKIEEYKLLIAKNEKVLKEISEKEQSLKDRIAEDNKLVENITEREKIMRQREIDVVTKEKEFVRKEMFFNSQRGKDK